MISNSNTVLETNMATNTIPKIIPKKPAKEIPKELLYPLLEGRIKALEEKMKKEDFICICLSKPDDNTEDEKIDIQDDSKTTCLHEKYIKYSNKMAKFRAEKLAKETTVQRRCQTKREFILNINTGGEFRNDTDSDRHYYNKAVRFRL